MLSTIDWGFVVAAILATTVVGLAKGGLSGLGILGMPILALAVEPVEAAAILLPLLIVQDVVGVWSFRHDCDWHIVKVMIPGAAVGVLSGWAFVTVVPVSAVMAVLGLISIFFGLWRLWIERGGRVVAAARSPDWVGTLFGVGLGFTSQVAHAGGPPFQFWVMPKQLPHTRFIGTSTMTFAIVNWMKVPAYLALGQFSRHDLTLSAALLPVAILSTLAGIWAVRRIRGRTFYTIVNLLMVMLGLKLLIDGLF